ncbi:MAG: thioesterase [Ignavibacteria bacterium]|nr:thioesterase [Ignavibacteria bacterium]
MFEKKYELRYFEMDKQGYASPTTIVTLLQEAVADHCLSIDYGLYDLNNQNIGWVLLAGYLQMERYPLYKEKITIRTWISKYSTIKGERENLIFDEEGKIIGRGKGLWLFFDIKRRRPVRVYEDIIDKWKTYPEESIIYDITTKIEPIEFAEHKKSFLVHRYDLDSNRHVNNLRYLQWLLETIPDEIIDNYFLHSIDGRYISEAQYGHTVESLSENKRNTLNFTHTIIDKDSNKICATGRTVWKKRSL